jgi:hypothetical protein
MQVTRRGCSKYVFVLLVFLTVTMMAAGALQLIFLFKCLEYTTGMYIHAYNGHKTSEIVKERCSLKSQELQTFVSSLISTHILIFLQGL